MSRNHDEELNSNDLLLFKAFVKTSFLPFCGAFTQRFKIPPSLTSLSRPCPAQPRSSAAAAVVVSFLSLYIKQGRYSFMPELPSSGHQILPPPLPWPVLLTIIFFDLGAAAEELTVRE